MLTLPAFAKINWTLRVLGRREDGFHEICTTFQTVSLCDYLTFETADEISLTCDNPQVPVDERNIIVRAANILREQFSVSEGAKIHLEKRIPSPGGLGGGSADAAVALLALTHLWQIETTRVHLTELGKQLGADVPFFLYGGTAFATGLGTEIEPLPDVPQKLLLIVTPNVSVPTAEAYQSLGAPRLTDADSLGIFTICRSARIDDNINQANLQNDFETTIFRLQPEIELAKNRLLESGATAALMSGSGASVFGIFENETTRQAALDGLQETDWQLFSCETVSRPAYEKFLSPCWSLLRDSL